MLHLVRIITPIPGNHNMTKIDLHAHTTASDGIYAPERLIDFAQSQGIAALAITDHDTVGGLAAAMAYAAGKPIDCIPGVELSLDYPPGSFHLVGLHIDYTNRALCDTLERLHRLRDTRIARIVDDLRSHGIDITLAEVEEESRGASAGRPHVARVLVRKGYAASTRKVFEDFLVSGKPGYVKKDKISLDEGIALIRNAGGIPVIAHPISLGFKDFREFETLLVDFIRRGVEGIEAYAAMHSMSEVDQFRNLAHKYQLVVTGGSDFHGDKEERIGYFAPERAIPFELYERLRTYRLARS